MISINIKNVLLHVVTIFILFNISGCDIIETPKEKEEKVVIHYFDNTYKRIYDDEIYYGYAKVYFNDDVFYVDYNEILEVEVEPGYLEVEIYVKEYNDFYEGSYRLYQSFKSFQTGGTGTTYINYTN